MRKRKEKKKKKAPALDHSVAMGSRPQRREVTAGEEDARSGGLRLTMDFTRPRWQQRMGAEARCRRTFVLDRLGREVYEACDGRCTVEDLARDFAERHAVSLAEAEYSVTTYLQTLMKKGLLLMEVDRDTAASI